MAAPLKPRGKIARVLSRVWGRVQIDDCIDLAAQMSFYFVMSLFPFCLVVAAVIGWLPSSSLWRGFAGWMVTYLPKDSQQLVFATILRLTQYSTSFFSVGLATAVWSASSGFVSLMESLSIVYGTKDSRSYWHKHAIATGVTFLAAAFALATFGLVTFGRWGSILLSTDLGKPSVPRVFLEIMRWIVTVLVMSLGIRLINFLLPVEKRRWQWITPGTLFAVLTLIVSFIGFNIYVQHFSSYPKIYGTLGGFIILMLWIYIASLILLVGAETDHEFEKLSGEVEAD